MAWIKHHDNATNSVLLSQLIDDLGADGYGRYWWLMELLRSEWKMEEQFITIHFNEIHRALRFYKKTITKQFLSNRSIVHIFFKDCYGIPSELFEDCSKIPSGLSEILQSKEMNIYTFNSQILWELADRDGKYNSKKNLSSDELATLDKRREEKKREDNTLLQTIIELYNTELSGLGNIKPCQMISMPKVNEFSNLKRNHPQLANLEKWKEVFDSVKNNAFLQGKNDSGWTVSLNWLIDEENLEKVLNGQFGGNKVGLDFSQVEYGSEAAQ